MRFPTRRLPEEDPADQHGARGDLGQAEGRGVAPEIAQLRRRHLQPDREQQKHDAQIGDFVQLVGRLRGKRVDLAKNEAGDQKRDHGSGAEPAEDEKTDTKQAQQPDRGGQKPGQPGVKQ